MIPKEEAVHIDNWLDEPVRVWAPEEQYAKFVLGYGRICATDRFSGAAFMEPFKLFCTYGGMRYRVIGASRMGDIWLATDFNRTHGYDERVYVNEVSNWGREP